MLDLLCVVHILQLFIIKIRYCFVCYDIRSTKTQGSTQTRITSYVPSNPHLPPSILKYYEPHTQVTADP